jgi:hypothetical protein
MVSDPEGADTFSTVFVHHRGGMRGCAYPRAFASTHTEAIPLHSRGRRTREASHGEGGLQAAGEVTHLSGTGLRITAWLQCQVASDH